SQGLHAEAIALLYDLGRLGEALEVSEQARARALLDLVASRAGSDGAPRRPGDESPVLADAPRPPEIVATARPLDSTVVEYFVAPSATYVFVVGATGDVRGARVAVAESTLRASVDRACQLPLVAPGDRRGLATRAGNVVAVAAGPESEWRRLD